MQPYSAIGAFLYFSLLFHCSATEFDLTTLTGRNNKLSGHDLKKFANYLQTGEVHINFGARQTDKTQGTLVRVSVSGSLLFQLSANAKQGELVLKYSGLNGSRVVKVPYNTSNAVHNFTLSIVHGSLHLTVDCQSLLHPENAPIAVSKKISPPSLKFFIGQKYRHTSYFLGKFTYLHISNKTTNNPQLCPAERKPRARAPIRDKDTASCPECVDFLKHRIARLEDKVRTLESNAHEVENMVDVVLQHQRGCYARGVYYEEGDRWEMANCTVCSCVKGRELCHPKGCPKVTCSKPTVAPGTCCPQCLNSCTYNGKLYEHGETAYPRKCVELTCDNGTERIRALNRGAFSCPELPCYESQQKALPDRCCPVCERFNHCAKGHHECGTNAYCENLKYEAICLCNPGYAGNPDTKCVDVDECQFDDDILDEIGCGPGTFCVNTPGSFECHCRPGFRRLDPRQCVDRVTIY